MTDGLAWLERRLDDRVLDSAGHTSPWTRGTQTFRVDLERHGRVAVQVGGPEHRDAIRRRIDVGRYLALSQPRFRVPEVLAGDAAVDAPFVVTRWVEGRPLSSSLSSGPEAVVRAAQRLGDVLDDLRRLPPAGLDLPVTWADPDRLQEAAARWLSGVVPRLEADIADVVSASVETTRATLDFASTGFAHGDFMPVNFLVDERGPVAVLDFEDARYAPGAFDPATLWTTLALHHPDALNGFEPVISERTTSRSSTLDRHGLAAIGCLQRLERASDAIAGIGSESAALDELTNAARLVARHRPRLSGSPARSREGP